MKKLISIWILILGMSALSFGTEDGHYWLPLYATWQQTVDQIGAAPDTLWAFVEFDTNLIDTVDLYEHPNIPGLSKCAWQTDSFGLYFVQFMAIWSPGDTVLGQDWVQTKIKTINSGSAEQTCSLFVQDTSGTPVFVPGVAVTIHNSAETAWIAYGSNTGANGSVEYNTTASTGYVGKATLAGYIFDDHSFTTGAAATDVDTIMGYDISLSGGTNNSEMATVGGYFYDPGGNILLNAWVLFELNHEGMPFTTNQPIVPRIIRTQTAASGGLWVVSVYGTDSTFNAISYDVTVTHTSLQAPIRYGNIEIPATAGSGAVIFRDLLTKPGE